MLMSKLKIAVATLFVATTAVLTCGVLAGQQRPGQPADKPGSAAKAAATAAPGQPPLRAEDKPPEPKPADAKKVPGPWFVAKVGDTMVRRDSLGSVSTQTVIKVDENECHRGGVRDSGWEWQSLAQTHFDTPTDDPAADGRRAGRPTDRG